MDMLFRLITYDRNTRLHPVSVGLLYLYCPAAAYWWRSGVEVSPPFNPVWQAVEDYTATPPRTLREHLEARGLKGLLDEARKYIDQVKTARQRLPHITAPELLPTFPGGKLPLRRRFGIKEQLDAIGGAEGFFAYVRTWAFLVKDWLAALPYGNPVLKVAWFPVRYQGVRKPFWLPVWAAYIDEMASPVVLGIPPGVPMAARPLYLLVQSPEKHPWPNAPQVWQFSITGEASPFDSFVPARDAGGALLSLADSKAAFPVAALNAPSQCLRCPFRSVCLREGGDTAFAWTPQAGALWEVRV